MAQLIGDEGEKLHQVLRSAFPAADDLDLLTQFSLNEALTDITPPAPHAKMVLEVIRRADSTNRIESLIRKALQQNDQHETLKAVGRKILERLAAAAADSYVPTSAYDTCLVSSQRVFVNREPLRQFFREMNDPVSFPVLAITGEEATGKTYSLQLIFYLKATLKSFRLAYIEFAEEILTEFTPEKFMKALARQAGIDSQNMPVSASSSASYNKELARWLVDAAGQQNVVIVLDGLNRQLTEPARELAIELVKRVGKGDTTVKLIVTGLDVRDLPQALTDTLREEPLGIIGDQELCEYFERYQRHRGHEPDAQTVHQIKERIKTQINPTEPRLNELINRLVNQEVRKLSL